VSEAPKIRYADPFAIFAEELEAILPADRVDVADFAAAHRYLAGAYIGRWNPDAVPYLVEPMRALSGRRYRTVAIVGPGQSAKTTVAENWLLHSVATSPASFLWYMQTDEGVTAYVKGRINPMVDAHDKMRERIGLRVVDDSLHFKRFRGMTIEFLSANEGNLINKSAPRIVADEIDAYPPSLGDVKALLDVRRQAYDPGSMLLALSHPDRAEGLDPAKWTAGIMSVYADSDRRVWYWPCPHCGAWSSPNPWGSRVMAIDYPAEAALDEIEAAARLVCPVNGCLIEDGERHQMNRRGRWIGNGQAIDEDGEVTGELVSTSTAGFWIVGAMSPFVLGGIGGLARARVRAERDHLAALDDDTRKTLRTVMAKQWGVPYSPPRQIGTIDPAVLADRAEPTLTLGLVPAGVRFLTVAVDCQLGHFDWLARGWGVAGESWIVDKGRLAGDPAAHAEDWDRLFAQVLSRAWPLADASGRAMTPRAVGYDAHGQAGVTLQALAAWRRWRRQGVARLWGRIAGRDAWSILPMRGVGTPGAARLSVTYPDNSSRTGKQRASRGDVPVGQFNTNVFKDDLAGQLRRAEPGSWYVHFPGALRSPASPQVWFEQLAAEQRDDAGRWKKKNNAARNEAFDQLVMTHVLAHLQGLPRIDWDNPPPWAADWEQNPAIAPIEIDPEAALPIGSRARPAPTEAPAPSAPAIAAARPGPSWFGERRERWF
jgi:phage terminase large subunit GpA-like protein